MKNSIRCSIIIPAFNEENYIESVLNHLENQLFPNDEFEVIVIDNKSTDSTREIVKKNKAKLFILEKGNVGAVRNLGVQKAKGQTLVFIDADCLADREWLYRGVLNVEKHPNLVFGGPYRTSKNGTWVERYWLLESSSKPRLQEDLLGGCIFVDRLLFEDLGGFNELMTSGEDSDFSNRIKGKSNSGVKILEELSVIHLGNPKTITQFFKRQIWHSENYMRFFKSSLKDKTFWSVLFFLFSFVIFFIAIFFRLELSYLPLTAIVGVTAIHSAKRLKDSAYLPKTIGEIIKILSLDFTYLSGRSVGLLKSLF